MSYSEPLSRQAQVFLVFFGVGCLLRLVYAAVSFLRALCGEGRAAYYIADTLFCAVSLLVLFFFFLAFTNGRVRLILLGAAGAGFAVTQCGVGRLFQRAQTLLASRIRALFSVLITPFAVVLRDVFRFGRRVLKAVRSWPVRVKKLRERRTKRPGPAQTRVADAAPAKKRKKARKFVAKPQNTTCKIQKNQYNKRV